MKSRTGNSSVQIALHRSLTFLEFATRFTREGMGRALNNRLDGGGSGCDVTQIHMWLGLEPFMRIAVPVLVPVTLCGPAPAKGNAPMLATAAHWRHRLLNVLMVVTPLLGGLVWFGGFRTVGELHEIVGSALFFVALAYAVVALWHQYVKQDGTLTRMLIPGG
ncbi:MAG: cytochrome b [Paracoccaceae bacterium]